MSRAALPDYADNGLGFPVFRAPYFQKDAKLAAFILGADIEKLFALCDATLNVNPDFPYYYAPVASAVLMVYADMLVSSRDERDARVGLIPETEVGFWILTLVSKKTKSGNFPSHLAWFLPYVFVDEANSIATGREVLGFNKHFARIEKAARLQKPQFAAQVLGFKEFGADKIAQWENLLRLEPFVSAEFTRAKDLTEVKTAVTDDLLRRARGGMDRILVRLASRFLNDPIPLVFLKQFRDATDSRKACYQQLVETRLRVENFRDGGIFIKPYVVTLAALASHPLIKTLGLKTRQGSRLGVWMNVDFTLGETRA